MVLSKRFLNRGNVILLHTGHIKLESHNISGHISMLTPGDIETMAHCSQCNINTSVIARLTSTRYIFETDTIWTRHQINYLM